MNQKLKLFQKTSMQSGITLVALVITIVILIILATISISAIFGDNGLITSAQKGKLEQEKAEARERLTLVLADAFTEKKVTEKYTEEEFLEKHLEEFVYEREPDSEIFNEEGQDLISLNGHVFELDRSVPQLGEWVGEKGNLLPAIRSINVENKTLSEITVKVVTARAEGATLRYSIKKLDEEETAYVEKEGNGGNTYTFTGLTSPEKYTIKVDLVIDNEIVDTKTDDVVLGELEEGTIKFGDVTWPGNGTASATVTTNTSYQLQYQINAIEDDSWQNISNGGTITNIPNDSNVYARLWDGTNASDYATLPVDDEVKPTIAEIKEVEKTETTIKVQVVAEDKESGITKIEYSKDDGTSYVTGTTATATEYTFEELTESTAYTVKVRVTDGAGNTAEISKKISTDGERFSEIYDKTTEYTDSEGNTAWIPGDFAVGISDGINKINDGLVIKDAKGNQFVWIPVEDYTTMYEEVTEPITLSGVTTTTNVYSKLRGITAGKPGTTLAREPDLVTVYDTQSQYYSILGCSSALDMADRMVTEYKKTYESIKHYGGFYIGRFELTGSMDNPTVKKGVVLANQNWYNLKKACTNIVSTQYAQSTMIYGNQWDEVCEWLKTKGYNTDSDSSSWGNYKDSTGVEDIEVHGSLQITGYSKVWNAQNIYDLAGNYWEWTQELYNTAYRYVRGGDCYYEGKYIPVISRGELCNPAMISNSWTSRPALYVSLNANS